MRRLAIMLMLCGAVTACDGGDNPAAPTPVPSALIEGSGPITFTRINEFHDYQFTTTIRNNGAGCAKGTVVVLRLYDWNGKPIGPDFGFGMDAPGGLSLRVIRPQDTVAVASGPIPGGWVEQMRDTNVTLTWDSVPCQ
jgi:hypothetical protein